MKKCNSENKCKHHILRELKNVHNLKHNVKNTMQSFTESKSSKFSTIKLTCNIYACKYSICINLINYLTFYLNKYQPYLLANWPVSLLDRYNQPAIT